MTCHCKIVDPDDILLNYDIFNINFVFYDIFIFINAI